MRTFLLHLLFFAVTTFLIVNFNLYASQNNLSLYLYSFDTQRNAWNIIWEETVETDDNLQKGISDINIPEAKVNDIFIAVKGQAIYYKYMKYPQDEINIVFSKNSLKFHVLDWISNPVFEIGISLCCYIPEIKDYIVLNNFEHNGHAPVILNNINPGYRYKLIINGPGIFEKEIYFSDENDFPEYKSQNKFIKHLFENEKAIYLVRKNSIYGSVCFENIEYQMPDLHTILHIYNRDSTLREMQSRIFHGNRFLFKIPEELNSEKFCLFLRDPLSMNEYSTFDLFVSDDEYNLYIEDFFGICGRVANSYFNFPVDVCAEIHYLFELASSEFSSYNKFNSFASDPYSWFKTDYNGYFVIPVKYPFEEYMEIFHLIKNEKLYADLFLKEPHSEFHLSYRYHFDSKVLERIKYEKKLINIGDINFHPGVEVHGNVADTNNKPVSNARVIFSHPGSYEYMNRIMSIPYDSPFKSHYIDAILGNQAFAITDEKGEFHINNSNGLIPDTYEIYLYHDSYVLTMYPNITLGTNNNLDTLYIADGNKLIVNVFTAETDDNIEVKIAVKSNTHSLDLIYAEEGFLRYSIERLIPWDRYEIMLYRSGMLIENMRLIFNSDERNETRIIDFIL